MKKNEMFKHIVAIRTAKNNSVTGGTGFFVKTEDEKTFLVTATHVARDTTINTDIWVRNLATGLPFAFKINQLNKMVMWLYHPIADIAILEVEPNEKLDLSLYVLPISFFEKSFSSVPERESIVTMYGMPDVYSDLEFAPFTCDSYPASDLWVAHFDVTGSLFKCFMLDKPSTQGFSGGPVISFAKADAPVCYGIIHGTRQDNTGGIRAMTQRTNFVIPIRFISGQMSS